MSSRRKILFGVLGFYALSLIAIFLIFGFTRRDNENATKELFVADADGSDMERVGEFDADVHDPTWSPDSALIAVVLGGNGSKIVIVEAETGAEVDRFGVDGATNMQPDWK